VSLHDIYEEYGEKVEFLVIYIREAHPTDGWYIGRHNIRDPKTMDERRRVAGRCESALEYGIRTYVDEMDDRVMKAYAAWPDRLYLIGLDGRVVHKGGNLSLQAQGSELAILRTCWSSLRKGR